jgi:hypothetical protein
MEESSRLYTKEIRGDQYAQYWSVGDQADHSWPDVLALLADTSPFVW